MSDTAEKASLLRRYVRPDNALFYFMAALTTALTGMIYDDYAHLTSNRSQLVRDQFASSVVACAASSAAGDFAAQLKDGQTSLSFSIAASNPTLAECAETRASRIIDIQIAQSAVGVGLGGLGLLGSLVLIFAAPLRPRAAAPADNAPKP